MERATTTETDGAQLRAAIGHLGDRERAALHRLHHLAVIDLREPAVTQPR